MRIPGLFAGLLFFPVLAFTQAPAATTKTHSVSTALDTLFQNRIGRNEMPGVVCLISEKGQIKYDRAFGFRNLATQLPMDSNTLFRMQSMNKAVITVGFLKLVDKGKVRLDDEAARYFPKLQNKEVGIVQAGTLTYVPANKPITFRHLLSHTSGLGSMLSAGALESHYQTFEQTNHADVQQAANALMQLPLIDQPGNDLYYGWGHLIVAALIEKLSGQPLSEYLQEEIFIPLGMNLTSVGPAKSNDPHLAILYTRNKAGKLDPVPDEPSYNWGSELVSTARDYHRFCMMLLNEGKVNGKQFLSAALVRELSKPVIDKQGELIFFLKGYAFALGVAVRVNETKAETKGSPGDYGWFGGNNTAFWIDPKKQIIGIVLTQADHNFYELARTAKSLIYSSSKW